MLHMLNYTTDMQNGIHEACRHHRYHTSGLRSGKCPKFFSQADIVDQLNVLK